MSKTTRADRIPTTSRPIPLREPKITPSPESSYEKSRTKSKWPGHEARHGGERHHGREGDLRATRNFGLPYGEERPGQDLNLRGVTQRFSRPPPYRTRRPGQSLILKTRLRISVPTRRRRKERLRPAPPSVGIVQVVVELVPRRTEVAVALESDATGEDLLKALRLPPDAHLLVRGDIPIPIDEPLRDGERIRVIGVVSGG